MFKLFKRKNKNADDDFDDDDFKDARSDDSHEYKDALSEAPRPSFLEFPDNPDDYAFIAVSSHGTIPISCQLGENGEKILNPIIVDNENVTLTQFNESASGCVGFMKHSENQDLNDYLREQFTNFFRILRQTPGVINPVNTYNFFKI